MLVKQGFNIKDAKIINPTAVFCIDRDKYNTNLSRADSGENQCLLDWCEYVLQGLITEVRKIENLTDYGYVKRKLLLPSIKYVLDKNYISKEEYKILDIAIKKVRGFKNNDVQKVISNKLPQEISRMIKSLRERRLIFPIKGERIYSINFENNILLRGVVFALNNEGFLPIIEDMSGL